MCDFKCNSNNNRYRGTCASYVLGKKCNFSVIQLIRQPKNVRIKSCWFHGKGKK